MMRRRLIKLFSNEIHQHEMDATWKLALRLFLIMCAYYLMKPVREALLLDQGSAELRSYVIALQALLLLLLVPVYGRIVRRFIHDTLFRWMMLFFISNLLVFIALGLSGTEIGPEFFVWLGIFAVVCITQFWAFATDFHTVEAGKRLIAYIAAGGSLGAVAGAAGANQLLEIIGPYGLLFMAAMLLATTLLPMHSESAIDTEHREPSKAQFWGGFKLISETPYLRWVVLFVVLLNLVNSIGEYILAHYVVEFFAQAANKTEAIGRFYSTFFLAVNGLTLLLQLAAVRPLLVRIGIRGTLIVLTLINLALYVSALIAPFLLWIAFIKVVENSGDYSIANTARQILFLPLDTLARYEGMTAANTFFWRLADMLQAGAVYLFVSLWGLNAFSLLLFNVFLCLLWVLNAVKIGQHFSAMMREREASQLLQSKRHDNVGHKELA